MNIGNNFNLTFCSNIFPGESWKEVFDSLKQNIPGIKNQINPNELFGIGLRLSNQAATELLSGNNIALFKNWLQEKGNYVFTINGFPYGGFHNRQVKDDVYKPDWTTNERLQYSLNLISVLEQLMEPGGETGFSTSPLSYKFWMLDGCNTTDVYEACCVNLIKCVEKMYQIRNQNGKHIHLDIEPEPDCLLENSEETISFFKEYLIPYGIDYLKHSLSITNEEAERIIKEHITVCYDICHFAVEFEEPAKVIHAFKSAGIKIGKVQISSALKILTNDHIDSGKKLEYYHAFAESTYLHQTVARNAEGYLIHFPDLSEAIKQFENPEFKEWRTHYHVPVFMHTYNQLQSTQEDILKVFDLLKKENFTNHLEVETYTWEVLPQQERLPLSESIIREMNWVIQQLQKNK